jgi:hypothetical protein
LQLDKLRARGRRFVALQWRCREVPIGAVPAFNVRIVYSIDAGICPCITSIYQEKIMDKNIGQLLDELAKTVATWRGDLTKIAEKHTGEVAKTSGALVPLLTQSLDAMFASIHLSRSTLEAEQLVSDIRLRGSVDAAVVQSTLGFIDARVASTDKARATMEGLLKSFADSQQAIKDHATAARTDLAKSSPPGGGSGGGGAGGGESGSGTAGGGTAPKGGTLAGKLADAKLADGKSSDASAHDATAKKGGGFWSGGR